MGLLDRHAFQPAEAHQLGKPPGFHHRAVAAQHLERHVQPGGALLDTPGQHPAEEVVIVEDGGDHGERRVLVEHRGRDMAQHQVEHRRQVLALVIEVHHGPALAARGEEHREIELLVGRIECCEQVEHLPHHGGAFGEDGYAPLAFKIVAVERALGHLLMFAERARLLEQLVHQGGLPMVDVSNDRDVADVHRGSGRGCGVECCGAHIGEATR